MPRIPKEPMDYKSLVKDSELLTKLRVIRLAHSPHVTQSRVAAIFGCHRNTVANLLSSFSRLPAAVKSRLIRDSSLAREEVELLMKPLLHTSSRPHHHPKEPSELQKYIVHHLHEECGWRVGYKNMHALLKRSFHDYQPIDPTLHSLTILTLRQVRTIYKNFELRTQRVRTRNGDRKPLYDYAALAAFERMHLDTKTLADAKSLPNDIYLNLLNNQEIPKYQWSLIDAKTKVRFVAYSYSLNAEFGLKFLLFVLCYIRFTWNNWETEIVIGFDNGTEFCSSSEDKLSEWNQIISPLNASCYSYHPHFDVRKNIVERSHRTDDEYFLISRGSLLTTREIFKKESRSYFEYYNLEKGHSGIGMSDMTPYEKLTTTNLLHPERLLQFPVLILEENIDLIRKTIDPLLFQAELRQKQAKLSYTLTQKQIINAANKYQFFDDSAQKVLTYYRPTL